MPKKLTEPQVREILRDTRSNTEIATAFMMSVSTIQRIRDRETWRFITDIAPQPRQRDGGGRFSKLTERQVTEILSDPSPTRTLAKRYEVTETCIRNIRKGRTWKHLDRPSEPPRQNQIRQLTLEQIKEIANNPNPTKAVASAYGISVQRVNRIRKSAKYKHLRTHDYTDPRRKLSPAQVLLVLADTRPIRAVASEYGVSYSLIYDIRKGRRWQTINKPTAPNDYQPDQSNHRVNQELAKQIYLDTRSGKAVAREYNLPPALVSHIRRRRAWANATADLPSITYQRECK